MGTFFAIVGAFVAINLIYIIINRLTSPIVKSAYHTAAAIRRARLFMESLEEGAMLNIADWGIMEVGQALLIDCVPVPEINRIMLRLLAEKLAKRRTPIWMDHPTIMTAGNQSCFEGGDDGEQLVSDLWAEDRG